MDAHGNKDGQNPSMSWDEAQNDLGMFLRFLSEKGFETFPGISPKLFDDAPIIVGVLDHLRGLRREVDGSMLVTMYDYLRFFPAITEAAGDIGSQLGQLTYLSEALSSDAEADAETMLEAATGMENLKSSLICDLFGMSALCFHMIQCLQQGKVQR